jgi:hypothetical protein
LRSCKSLELQGLQFQLSRPFIQNEQPGLSHVNNKIMGRKKRAQEGVADYPLTL